MARSSEQREWLSLLAKAKPKRRIALLRTADKPEMEAISECCYNFLKGHPKFPPRLATKLKRYKNTLRFISKPRTCWKKKKAKVIQDGGFLPLILGPLISGVAGIVSSLISRR